MTGCNKQATHTPVHLQHQRTSTVLVELNGPTNTMHCCRSCPALTSKQPACAACTAQCRLRRFSLQLLVQKLSECNQCLTDCLHNFWVVVLPSRTAVTWMANMQGIVSTSKEANMYPPS